jgi:hypothetical protein
MFNSALMRYQERLTAREAMAHPYFEAVRQAELVDMQNATNNAHQ